MPRPAVLVCCALFALLSTPAFGATINSITCSTPTDGNTMRYDCEVDLTASDSVRIGFRPTAGGTWKWSDYRSGDPVDFVLYNFTPGISFQVRAQIAGGADDLTTSLGTPTLPPLLDDLKLTVTASGNHASYVLFDTPDCQLSKNYLVAVRAVDGKITWYQDIEDATGVPGAFITGWSYTDDQTILVIVNNRFLYEWNLDGTIVYSTQFSADCAGASGDAGPCPHHDAFRCPDNGKTYMVTAALSNISATGTAYSGWGDFFTDDGFRTYNSTYSSSTDHSLINHMGFAPTSDLGPTPYGSSGAATSYWTTPIENFDSARTPLDWTHANSISAFQVGQNERVTMSLRQWSHIIQFDPSADTVEWELNGNSSAYSTGLTIAMGTGITGTANFGGVHNVNRYDGDLLMFDNRYMVPSGGYDARAILMDINTSTGYATINKSWVMREPGTPYYALNCGALGSAQVVPGTDGENVLANCGTMTTIEEIDEGDGNRSEDPVLYISLDHTGGHDYCDSEDNEDPENDANWYRAYPLIAFGEF